MNDLDTGPEQTKRYLLGYLTEEERQEFEVRVITDRDYREHANMVETELIDEYVAGRLPEPEREQFEIHFLSKPEQVQRVRIAQALRLYATGAAERLAPENAQTSRKKNPVILLPWLRPAAPTLIAVLLVVVVVGSWALYKRWQAQSEQAAIASELSRLNNHSPQGLSVEHSAASTLIVNLMPVQLRSVDASQEIVITPRVSLVELRLGPTNVEYDSYRIELQGSQQSNTFTIDGLKATVVGPAKLVMARIPARILVRDDYEVRLVGFTAANQIEDAGNYYFRVVGP